jgi:hypothetical protein
MGHEPAFAHPLRSKIIAIRPQRRYQNQEECRGEGKDAKGDSVIKPPDKKEQPSHRQAEQRLNLAHAYRHPAMGLDKHFNSGDEMEEESHPAQVNAGFAPPQQAIDHGRKDSHTCRRIKDSRNSQPKQIHVDLHLNGVDDQYTVTQITKRTGSGRSYPNARDAGQRVPVAAGEDFRADQTRLECKYKAGPAWIPQSGPAFRIKVRFGPQAKSLRLARVPITNNPAPSNSKLDGSGVTCTSKLASPTKSPASSVISKYPV